MTSNITPFKKLAEKLLEDRNYEDLEYLLNLEKEKSQYLSTEDEFYLLRLLGRLLIPSL
ncbi:transcriptional regulator [Streptococcus pneumoniae]|nr:transcriptional regulator [Streptococcus pneumoniae]